MKSIFKNIFFFALASTLLVSCANDDNYSAPASIFICEDQTEGLTANISGADLYAMATPNLQQFSVDGDDYLEGYITSSDRGGNFFKTVSIETTDGRGLSISIDIQATYTEGYRVGRRVLIKLNGLYFHINHGSLSIGEYYVNAGGFESAGRISEGKVKDHVFFTCDFMDEEVLIHDVSVAQSKSNDYINKLIRLSEVEFVEAGSTYYDPNNAIGGASNRTIKDYFGSTVIFRTGSFAHYSGLTIPYKSGKITGIMTKFNNDFQFVSRDEHDIQLTEEPLGDLQPVTPSPDAVGVFPGHEFENWTEFLGGLSSHGIRPYANQSVGTGIDGSNSLHIQTSGTSNNELVFTSLAYADLPENPTRLIFWLKGTSAKSLSISMFRADAPAQWVAFNLGNVTVTKGVAASGSNSFTQTIDTGGEWVQIVLDLASAGFDLNTSDFNSNFFGIRVGNNASYDLHLDNFTVE